ncbi:acyltransferase domain-containing protein [Mesorhizobium sp.]|uniref:acyltransferase domain-containing protein n=1 Tax=Mesorhizobium sp. TaxID=1871066 RepID=UPI0025BF76B8|nr:acyltransferase domain-containing protein [Mesorhizobium sp.]
MSGIAILCSGQGKQSAAMFDLVASEPTAAPVFALAAGALGGRDPRDLAHQGGDIIHRNDVAQVLCCAAALAVWAAVGSSASRPITVAGYSAGEVPAWAVAGVMDASSAFNLVTRRAALMDEATREPSGLAAIIGLPRDVVDGICRAYGLDVAIVNGPLHLIVGGRAAGLRPALADATARGATRATVLPIHVASHTPALKAVSERLGRLVSETVTDARLPSDVRLVSGIDGASVRGVADGLVKLAAQVSTTIDWTACMDACRASRPARVLELGPGSALSRMMTEFEPGIPARSAADFRSVAGLRRWIEVAS